MSGSFLSMVAPHMAWRAQMGGSSQISRDLWKKLANLTGKLANVNGKLAIIKLDHNSYSISYN